MTDAGWTREKPKEAGWYWHKSGTVITLVRLILRGGALLLWVPDDEPRSAAATFAPYPGTEWLGPISPDTYHQGRVAGELFGLQQGLLIAYIFESGTAKQVIEGIKSRIAEIEQQAQIEALQKENPPRRQRGGRDDRNYRE